MTADLRAVDPARLLRALGLTVTPVGPDTYRVTGGREPHLVQVRHGKRWLCDCSDTAFRRGRRCKHIIATFLARQLGPGVLAALRDTVTELGANQSSVGPNAARRAHT